MVQWQSKKGAPRQGQAVGDGSPAGLVGGPQEQDNTPLHNA